MLIQTQEERLLVISDLHLGNPYSLAAPRLRRFMTWAGERGFSLVINGDGLEILQASFTALAQQSVDSLGMLRQITSRGGRVYYVVGNHDLPLEHLLGTWLKDHISPFLNVDSGTQRIRIEHGHLYDPFFVNHPRAYDLATRAVGPFLHLYPDVYRLWSMYQRWKEARRKRRHPDRPGHGSAFHEAAEMLLARGFDTVIFGHTHKPEVSVMDRGGTYINSGNWLRDSTFVQILHGHCTLMRWHEGTVVPVETVPPRLSSFF